MTREQIERRQVGCYLAAVVLGLVVGAIWPQTGAVLRALVWPALVLLLYVTFVQVPLTALPSAFTDARFLVAALVGNFLVVPVVVWGLVQLVPDDDAVRLGLLLVLLVPCTDWFVTFTQLGRGDATRATALTPLILVVQLLLLPVYLWIMAGAEFAGVLTTGDVWPALLVVLVPLGLAALSEVWLGRRPGGERVRERLGWGPVPLLSLVIFLVATGHVGLARAAVDLFPLVTVVVALFLAVALMLARLLARSFGLPAAQGRTLAFGFGTRNSFVVLPVALSLPAGWEAAAIVIVMQSLAELFGMIFCLWFVPRVLFPVGRPAPSSSRSP